MREAKAVALARPVRCALTIDVEDWYQSFADRSAPLSERVVRNTEQMLALLDDCHVRATFFVLGEVARRFPALVRRIAANRHEVQSHGDRHVPLTDLEPPALLASLRAARIAVEDACGVAVDAFRAPYFSIGPRNLDRLRVVREAGFTVDSSIFPMAMRRYGIAGWPLEPRRIEVSAGSYLVEAPVSVFSAGTLRFPIGGGGYVRLLPGAVVERACHQLLAKQRPVVLYCHPYELNPSEVDEFPSVPWLSRRMQGYGRGFAVERWRRLLTTLPFGTLRQVLEASSVSSLEAVPAAEGFACASS